MTIPNKRSWSTLAELNDRSVPPNQASKGLCMMQSYVSNHWWYDISLFSPCPRYLFSVGPPKKRGTNSELTLFQACIRRWWFQKKKTYVYTVYKNIYIDIIFIPIWGRFPTWRAYFSDGLVKNHQPDPSRHPARLRNKNKPGQMQAKNVVGGEGTSFAGRRDDYRDLTVWPLSEILLVLKLRSRFGERVGKSNDGAIEGWY